MLQELEEKDYQKHISNIYDAINHLKSININDSCKVEYEKINTLQEELTTFQEANKWIYSFSPYTEFKEIFETILKFIDKYNIKGRNIYFTPPEARIIYELCDGKVFESSLNLEEFEKTINLRIGAKKIKYKKGSKIKTCSVISILKDHLKPPLDEIWEQGILKELSIVYKKTYSKKKSEYLDSDTLIKLKGGLETNNES